MWIMICFDLPTMTKKDLRNYVRFHKMLEDNGFSMMQFSIYIRHASSVENAEAYERLIQSMVPPAGHVRVFMLTDKQFGMQKIYFGKRRMPPPDSPQLSLFV